MGTAFLDAYSLLHFSVGVVVRHWNMSFLAWFFLHILFEILENTETGMGFINRYLRRWWPGGKSHADSLTNRAGDTVAGLLGWWVADRSIGYNTR